MDFDEVRALRASLADDDPKQGPLSVEDRRAFTRDYIGSADSALGALANMAIMFPLIVTEPVVKEVAKYLPLTDEQRKSILGRSGQLPEDQQPPILATIGGGLTGIGQGLSDYFFD